MTQEKPFGFEIYVPSSTIRPTNVNTLGSLLLCNESLIPILSNVDIFALLSFHKFSSRVFCLIRSTINNDGCPG